MRRRTSWSQLGRHEDVDEAGAGHVDLPDERRLRQRGDDRVGDLARQADPPGASGERHVRREVAVLLLPRLLELGLGQLAVHAELPGRALQSEAQPGAEIVLDHGSPSTIAARTVWTSAAVSNGFATKVTGAAP